LFKSLFKSAFATRTEIQFTCRRFRSQQSHSKRSRPRGGFSAQHLRDLDASAARHNCKMRMGNTIRRAGAARVPIPARGKRCCDPREGGPRLKPRRSAHCKGGADFPHFVAVRILAVAAVGGGLVELVARDLVERALHAARGESAHSTRALAAVHESESGTKRQFAKCKAMSGFWG
jgi:hypothetical protein